jgi:hypothetical protein
MRKRIKVSLRYPIKSTHNPSPSPLKNQSTHRKNIHMIYMISHTPSHANTHKSPLQLPPPNEASWLSRHRDPRSTAHTLPRNPTLQHRQPRTLPSRKPPRRPHRSMTRTRTNHTPRRLGMKTRRRSTPRRTHSPLHNPLSRRRPRRTPRPSWDP